MLWDLCEGHIRCLQEIFKRGEGRPRCPIVDSSALSLANLYAIDYIWLNERWEGEQPPYLSAPDLDISLR